MSKKIRWGIISTGGIAHAFAKSLAPVADAEIAAVASRTKDKADAFAHEFNAKRSYGSYEQLAQDPDIDIIYIGTPHSFHMDNTIMSLTAGKSVLCEKPLAINAAQARRMIQTAGDMNLFLMEAMWTRFNPTIAQVRNWLNDGRIGDVKLLCADFGIRRDWDPAGRMLNPNSAAAHCLTSAYIRSLSLRWPLDKSLPKSRALHNLLIQESTNFLQ